MILGPSMKNYWLALSPIQSTISTVYIVTMEIIQHEFIRNEIKFDDIS